MILEQENPMFKVVVLCVMGKKLEDSFLKHNDLGI